MKPLTSPITVAPSGGYAFATVATTYGTGPTVKLLQESGGAWIGCPEWHADTIADLANRPGARLCIMGGNAYTPDWTLDEADTEAFAAFAQGVLDDSEHPDDLVRLDDARRIAMED